MTTQDTAQVQAENVALAAELEHQIGHKEEYRDMLAESETQLSALRAAVQEVRPYLEHKDGCQQRCAPTPLSSRMCEHGTKSCMMLHGACTCGLDRLSRLLEPQG